MTDEKKAPYALGRRKTAVATVRLVPDAKKRVVNDLAMADYFTTISMQASVLRPLEVTSQHDVFGFEARVRGGGKHAQADALKLAIARALIEDNAARRRQLRDSGLLTRDSRRKERKKPGLKRARRAPQFSKR